MDIVIGAGVGGLSAATALARAGREVTLIEGRDGVGGLASGFELRGAIHDGGPYILLDRPGLEWAFERLGARLEDAVELIHLDDEVYRVRFADGGSVSIYGELDRTAEQFDAQWPGSGARYRAWVHRMAKIYANLTIFFFTGGFLNIVLALFNLLPIPPLDGSTILTGFSRKAYELYQHPQAPIFGMMVIMVIFMTNLDVVIWRAAMGLGRAYVDGIGGLIGNPNLVDVIR